MSQAIIAPSKILPVKITSNSAQIQQISSALQASKLELDEVREALIELYLDVKVRPQDEVFQINVINA